MKCFFFRSLSGSCFAFTNIILLDFFFCRLHETFSWHTHSATQRERVSDKGKKWDHVPCVGENVELLCRGKCRDEKHMNASKENKLIPARLTHLKRTYIHTHARGNINTFINTSINNATNTLVTSDPLTFVHCALATSFVIFLTPRHSPLSFAMTHEGIMKITYRRYRFVAWGIACEINFLFI